MDLDVAPLISRWLHLVGVIIAIGGAACLRFAVLPALKTISNEDERQRVHEVLRARWARVVQVSIALIFLTGAANFLLLALPPKVEPMPYHAIFGLKFFAAMFIFFIASALVGKSPGFAGIRAKREKWLTILLLTAAVVVLVSLSLGYIRG
ncbi:MAG: hypothetical protein IID36_07050 [Planctomycetes bacterium]|nr:hypothetical protein [Planctomycetota bacterium]